MAYQVSERWKRSVTASYRFAHSVEVVRGGVTVATGLQVVGGDVQADRSADVRRTCTLTVVGVPEALIPTRTNRSPLDPYGNELVVKTGIAYPDGTTELVPQGVFGITDSDLTDTADGVAVRLSGADRSDRIAKAKLLTPWSTASGTGAVAAIQALAEDRFPGIVVVDLTSSADTFPTHLLEEKANPWTDGIEAFAEAVGAEAFMDRSGRLVVRDVPDLGATPVAWRFVEGVDCTVTELQRRYTDDVPNAVVVTGETFDAAPVRAVCIDDDPESATYYGPDEASPVRGGYGPRPVWETSPLVTTQTQAQAYVDARGRALFGATERVVVRIVPNGAVDEGDVVYVRRGRSGFDDVLVVDSFTLPLTFAGTMDLACYVRRTVAS
jgi:hypothetical protein